MSQPVPLQPTHHARPTRLVQRLTDAALGCRQLDDQLSLTKRKPVRGGQEPQRRASIGAIGAAQ